MTIREKFYRGMEGLSFKWSLIAVASLLSLHLLYDLFIPRVVLRAYESDYQWLVTSCEKALRSVQETQTKAFNSERLRYTFRATVEIELLNCADRQLLRETLSSWGASPSSLRAIELEALLQDARVPTRALTSPFVKSK